MQDYIAALAKEDITKSQNLIWWDGTSSTYGESHIYLADLTALKRLVQFGKSSLDYSGN